MNSDAELDAEIDELVGLWDVRTAEKAVRASEGRDKVRGMLLGVALGDALGAPYEFRGAAIGNFSGLIDRPVTRADRFRGGQKHGALGMVTDDTEMTIALAVSVCTGVEMAAPWSYAPRRAAQQYLSWANSKCPFMGKNTRALFQGVKTFEGYLARMKATTAPSEGNGCLMRASPLATLHEWDSAAAQDCALTNPTPNCIAAVRAYVCALRQLLLGASPAAATEAALAHLSEQKGPDVVIAAITEGRAQAKRDITGRDKGWTVHALYCAFFALNLPGPACFQDRVDAVVRLGGDTDTNAAIAGAMLGAWLGETKLGAEERTAQNIATILACDSVTGDIPRPEKYSARRIPELADTLAIFFTR